MYETNFNTPALTCTSLNPSKASHKSSRWYSKMFFFFNFSRKWALTFCLNCLPDGQFTWNASLIFLEKKKNTHHKTNSDQKKYTHIHTKQTTTKKKTTFRMSSVKSWMVLQGLTFKTRVLQNVLSLGLDYFSATFYQTYFYYKPSKYSPFTETHFCNLFYPVTKSR